MSDRLDIVRLIDAKVTSTRRTVTRSKQLAEAAKGDLHIHEDWLRQHNERFDGDVRRQHRGMKRRERIENNKRFAKSVALFLPRLGARLCRALVSGFRTAGEAFVGGCAWLGRIGYAVGSALFKRMAAAAGWFGAKALTLGMIIAAALWRALSALGANAYTNGATLIGLGSRGLSVLGREASSAGHQLAADVSHGVFRRAAAIGRARLKAGGDAKRQASHLMTRLRSRPVAADTRPAADLDPRRLQHASLVRLRAEHDRLQARIHAMDRHYEQRPAHRRRDTREWVELRKLALNAQRLFDVQERQVLGPVARREASTSRSAPAGEGHPAKTLIGSLRAGYAVYEAPALPATHRRA